MVVAKPWRLRHGQKTVCDMQLFFGASKALGHDCVLARHLPQNY
jgi:hypothetical protein